MTKLFSPITFKEVTIKNRIVMSPMCMYSSTNKDGKITQFHMNHYISRAIGQVGLMMTDDTSVQPEGRISLQEPGSGRDDHVTGIQRLKGQQQT